jgi:hypothetical protein
MRWVGNVACVGEMRNSYGFSENIMGRVHLIDQGVSGQIISTSY